MLGFYIHTHFANTHGNLEDTSRFERATGVFLKLRTSMKCRHDFSYCPVDTKAYIDHKYCNMLRPTRVRKTSGNKLKTAIFELLEGNF